MSTRDPSEFSKKTIETLAKRAAQTCSNPDCRRPTSGPHSDKDKSVIVGKAAHIKGQKKNRSARYDTSMTDEQRGDISNGIWLCGVCHDVIDRDEVKYTPEVLRAWRIKQEEVISKAMISSLGFRQDAAASLSAVKADVLEDENIKKAMQAWASGDIVIAFECSQNAYYHPTSPDVKLQSIINMVLLSQDQIKRVEYYASLCDEGIILASKINDISTRAVLKVHKAYFLQHRAFSNSLLVYQETQIRSMVGYPTMSDVQLKQLIDAIQLDTKEINALTNDAQKDAYESKSYSALAHVKMTAGNTIGLTYFIIKQLGLDTGQTEHMTIRLLSEAKDIYEKLGDKEGIGNALHNIANNLRFFGDIPRAKALASEALQIAKETGYKELEVKAAELLKDRLEEDWKPE